MFRKMPFILVAIIASICVAHTWIPLSCKSILYAISLSLKSIVVFSLPLVIFGLLFKTASHLAQKASNLILLLVVGVCTSNFLSTSLSYTVGHFAYGFDLSMTMPNEINALVPAWQFSLPKWIGNDYAMLSGVLSGVLVSIWKPRLADKISLRLEKAISLFLQTLLYVIPVFITGFIIKMNHDQVMTHILQNYAFIFSLIAGAVFTYIAFIYLAANYFEKSAFIKSLQNMMPAAITGFGSMSSAAAMPLTILGTEKNSHNPDIARAIIPATVSTHLIGDCFAIPIFAFAVMKSFGVAEPSLLTYLTFAFYFVLAKFSVAAVPGGGILVMLPVLESTLGFDGPMLSLITALYILFDPVITLANILGNGGFALVIDRLSRVVSRQKS